MPNTYTDRAVESLIINKMTQAQYDALPEKSDTELYLIDGGESSMFAEQMIVMPEASEAYLNRIVQFIGNSTMTYITGYFYRCVLQGGTYIWKKINVQANQGGGGSGQEIQFDDLPEATSENVGQILQYVGETIPDVCEKGYFYINQFYQSDPELAMEQTGGPVDSISFETVSGNVTISGTVEAIKRLYSNYIGGMPKGGTITITYGTPYQSTWWNFAIHDESGEKNYPGTQSTFESNGFTFTGTPTGGEEIECTYTVGNIYNIQIDENQFKNMVDPTPGDTFVFTADGNSPMSATASVEYSEDPDLTISINAETYYRFALSQTGDAEMVGDQYGSATLEYFQEEDWEDPETGDLFPGNSYWILTNGWGETLDWIEPEDVGVSIVSGYTTPGDMISISFISEGEAAWFENGSEVLLDEYGIYYEGFAREGDEISVSCTAESGYEWKQINVQPFSGGSGEEYPTIPMYTSLPVGTNTNGYIDYNLGSLPDGKYEFFVRGTMSNIPSDQYYKNEYAWGIRFIIRNGVIVTEDHFESGDVKYSFYYPKPEWVQNFSEYSSGEPGVITQQLNGNPWSAGMVNGNAHICGRYQIQGYFTGTITEEPLIFVSKIRNLETNQKYDILGIELGIDGYAKYGESNFGRGHSNYSMPQIEKRHDTQNSSFGIPANGYMDVVLGYAYFTEKTEEITSRKQQEAFYISARTDSDDDAFDAKIDWDSGTNVNIIKATGLFSDSYIGYLSSDSYWKNLRVIVHNNTDSYKNCTYTVTRLGGNEDVSAWPQQHSNEQYIKVLPCPEVGSEFSIKDFGTIKQYTKETDSNYTNGYFYKATGDMVIVPLSYKVNVTNYADITVTCADALALRDALCATWGWSTQYAESCLRNEHTFYVVWNADNSTISEVYFSFWGWTSSNSILSCFSVSTTGSYSGQFQINSRAQYRDAHEELENPHWEQINVQPGSSPSYPSTMPVLLQDNWEEDQETGELVQTISNISEVHANSVVIVAPAPTSTEDYANNEVLCIGQGEGSLTFKCATIPNNDITVNVICL